MIDKSIKHFITSSVVDYCDFYLLVDYPLMVMTMMMILIVSIDLIDYSVVVECDRDDDDDE